MPIDPASVRRIRYDLVDGRDEWRLIDPVPPALQRAVADAVNGVTPVPTPTPIPTPTPTPVPTPGGIRVQAGEDWRRHVKTGAIVLLPRGATFGQGYGWDQPQGLAGVTLASYGDPALPPPCIAVSSGPCLVARGWRNLSVSGIDFQGSRQAPVVRLFGCESVRIHGCGITRGAYGVTSEGRDGKRCKGVTVEACRIYDNDMPGTEDSTGLFASETDGLVIRGNLIDRNGHGPTTGGPTVRNQNVYVAGNCGPVVFTGNVSSRAASHGLQARTGGTVTGNLFLDNPIHLSFGLVHGTGPIFKGGVAGEVSGNWFLGSADIGEQERGYCIQLGNIKQAVIQDNWMGSENGDGPAFAAIQIEACNLLPESRKREDAGIQDLTIQRNRCEWRGGPYRKSPAARIGRWAVQPTWGGPMPDVRSRLPAGFLDGLRAGGDVSASIAAVAALTN